MNIVNFEHTHIDKAMEIALLAYKEERQYVPILPKVDRVPDLTHFADNQLGVAAFDEDRMLGFLCAYQPLEDAFGTTNARGTFTPMHAHGVLPNNELIKTGDANRYSKEKIYSLLYQEAAKKWVNEGIKSHAIALYTHDKDGVNSFFYNGFGLRCIDAIRSLEESLAPVDIFPMFQDNMEFCEVSRMDWGLLLEFHNGLIHHLGESPCFMKYNLIDEMELLRRTSEDTRYFGVKHNGSYVAYIKISKDGENFATEDQSMMNICGAFCNPIYRGSGLYYNLLCYLISTLISEGYQRLGVDCESFNPTARGFWLKYFSEYTHSVVRRIDDKAIKK